MKKIAATQAVVDRANARIQKWILKMELKVDALDALHEDHHLGVIGFQGDWLIGLST